MHSHDGLPAPQRRLHGRLLRSLVLVAALVTAIGAWQLSTLVTADSTKSAGDPLDLAPVTGGTSATVSEPDTEPTEDTLAAPVDAPPSPTPDPEPTTTAEPPLPTCTAVLRVDNAHAKTVSVTVEVRNTGESSAASWEVTLSWDQVDLKSVHGMEDLGDGRYGGGRLEPGQSVEPGFEARVRGNAELPATAVCSAR